MLSNGQLVTPILLPQRQALALVFLRIPSIPFPVSTGRAAPAGATAPAACDLVLAVLPRASASLLSLFPSDRKISPTRCRPPAA